MTKPRRRAPALVAYVAPWILAVAGCPGAASSSAGAPPCREAGSGCVESSDCCAGLVCAAPGSCAASGGTSPAGSSGTVGSTSGGSTTSGSTGSTGGSSGGGSSASASSGGSSGGSTGGSTGSGGGSTSGSTGGSSGGSTGGALQVASLDFVVVGDTRPASSCTDSASCAYPTQVIDDIFTQVKGLSPAPAFAVATGDYMDNAPGDGTAAWQIQQYLSAQQIFGGPLFPAMGNHECGGGASSNCTPPYGANEDMAAYLGMLATLDLQNAVPYYAVNVSMASGQTAKLLVIAANAWDQTQADWLTSALGQPTSYTFIVRHEPATIVGTGCAGLDASEQILSSYLQQNPGGVTYKFVGHTHEYLIDGQNGEVIVGNGGAPWSKSATGLLTYGFLLCRERADSAIQCELNDSQGGGPVAGTAFAVNPDGSSATVQ